MQPVYPKTRDLADLASASAQALYMILTGLQLVFISLCAFVAGISAKTSSHQRITAWGVCALMFCALTASLALKIGKFDVRWFKCRAFAENAKSIVWQYVMADRDLQSRNEDDYLREWTNLERRLREVHSNFAISAPDEKLITEWMTKASQLELSDKISLYRRLRLDDQRVWYSTNSRKNAQNQGYIFWGVFAFELGVIAYAAIQAWLLAPVNLVGFLVSVGSGMLVWAQVKRFSDLATTYSVAAEDLSEIASKYRNIPDQISLDKFVIDVEDAVSREHNLWLSRRISGC